MLVIDVKVKGCEIELSQPTIASGMAGKAILHFHFDSEWQGLAKTAVFNLPRGNVLIPLDDDVCVFPTEVLAKSGSYRLGVFGTDGDNTLASVFCSVRVEHGAAVKGSSAANYTPDLYEQFSAKFAKFENMSATAAEGEAVGATISEVDGKKVLNIIVPRGKDGEKGDRGEKGEPGYTPMRGVDYWTEDDVKEIIKNVYHGFCYDDGRPTYGGIVSFASEEDFEAWKAEEMHYYDPNAAGSQNMIVLIAGVPRYFYSGWFGEGYLPFAAPMLDSEKAAIDERFDKLSAASELIETITVEEDGVTAVKRTEEPDGTPYNFKSLEIFVRQKQGANNSRCGFVFGIKETADSETTSSPIISPSQQTFLNTADSSTICRVNVNHGNLHAETTARASTLAAYTPTDLQLPNFTVENSVKAVSINGVRYYSLNSYVIPVGTTIEIWGERNA
ncbi:MAG: hypothetical protein E7598_06040 [Ruminococcaceae bacterium]|nr:hypothetical protein [Oscillospiraceae bacterium]